MLSFEEQPDGRFIMRADRSALAMLGRIAGKLSVMLQCPVLAEDAGVAIGSPTFVRYMLKNGGHLGIEYLDDESLRELSEVVRRWLAVKSERPGWIEPLPSRKAGPVPFVHFHPTKADDN